LSGLCEGDDQRAQCLTEVLQQHARARPKFAPSTQ
jgi:hypothetical protein